MTTVPPYVDLREIADVTGWDIQYARRFLKRSGILEKNGRLWFVADDRLREHFLPIYERVYQARSLSRRQRASTSVKRAGSR